MRTLLVAASMLIAGCIAASAGKSKPSEDYANCLISQAAIALFDGPKKIDSDAALDIAYEKCKRPKMNEAEDGVGLDDYVNLIVMKMAGEY
jgi:hypothetical protein